MQLAVDSETLLASLALSPPHSAHPGPAATEAADALALNGGSQAGSPGTTKQSTPAQDARVEGDSSSHAYHAHVLHQIAVAATPRRTRAGAGFPRNDSTASTSTSNSTASSSSSSTNSGDTTAHLGSPSDDALEFHLDDTELEFASLDSARGAGGAGLSHGQPLAHLDPARKLATPGDLIAQVAKEVRAEEVEAEDDTGSGSSSRRGSGTGAAGHHRVSSSGAELRVPKSPSSHPPPRLSMGDEGLHPASPHNFLLSPSIAMSPASIAEFRKHMESTYDIQLSPLPEADEGNQPAAAGGAATTPSATKGESTGSNAAATALDSEKSKADAARSVLLRQRIIEELFSSERSYLQSLENLLTYFVKPLRANLNPLAPPPFPYVHVTKAQQDTLFGAIELIVAFNRKLCEEVAQALQAKPADLSDAEWYGRGGPAIGAIFLGYSHFLKMYTSYCANHEAALALLQQLEKDRPFVAFCTKQAALSGSTLQSHLIGPIQRVPRYSLLLQELLRKTPSTHPDYAALTRSLSLVNHAASHINESVRAAQNRAQILALQERFGQSVSLLAPGRWFVRQGSLTKQGRHSDVEYQFLLFSDVLLYAAPTVVGNQLRLHRSIPLDSSFHFASLPDEDDATPTHAASYSLSLPAASLTDQVLGNGNVGFTSPMSEGGERLRSESADLTHLNVRSPSSTAAAAGVDQSTTPSSSTSAVAVGNAALPASSPAKSGSSVHRFLLETRERSFVVYAKTAQLKREWLADLQAVTLQIKLQESQRSENVALARAADSTLDSMGHARSASRSNSISLPAGLPVTLQALQQQGIPTATSPTPSVIGARPPVLQQFKSTSVCVVCSKLCTSFSGRRHCQACGHIACSRCCRTELFLPWAQKETRVCDLCVDKFKQAKIEKDRRASLDATAMANASAAALPSLPSGPAPPLPARPTHHSTGSVSGSPGHPSRPVRPSKSKVSLLLHSRMGSDAIPRADAEAGRRPPPADVNSDDEPEDLAGVLSPKGRKMSSTEA